MLLIRLFALWPFWVLYLWADFIGWLAFSVIGYRKAVVIDNLKKSFPEKSDKEIKEIARRFYRNLGDIIVESLKVVGLSERQLQKRVSYKDYHILEERLKSGTSVIVMTPHSGNWEWLLLACSYLLVKSGFGVDAVYSPLSNQFFDRLMIKIRSKFGADPTPMNMVLRNVIKNKGKARVVAMVADQRPLPNESNYWTEFLHQETAFFIGSERIARKVKFPVVYTSIRRLKRGYYEVSFQALADPPYDKPASAEDMPIIERFAHLVEQDIKACPDQWLWSHKRWKHKRPQKSTMEN
ncbi:lysophospholipid acyltransferase family protein [Microscilla marina]|uniref:Acyltransferase, HtrB/MsbB family n=1 Tax=Microscilla marina ATCC 23134 TaxID=313606 RepID=A1ZST5_MICM2|nr:lysophospholipid acyltransferase family protein [Microscilla marina]EAY26499.1 acyltransferase, HtrB/MsbB family [Microscilla marina ATCC 23134]